MTVYPLTANKANWRLLDPVSCYYSEEYTASMYDLYLTTEHIKGDDGRTHRYYRLHAKHPHNIEMALAYDIKRPVCGRNLLKQVGRCRDFYTLGLYECPACDRK